MDTTEPTDEAGGVSAALERWALGLIHHPRAAEHNDRWTWLEPGTFELGRASEAFGAGALDDGSVSRAHAVLELGPLGELTIRDAGSRNGTHVNGRRVEHAPLGRGDVISVGGVLLLVEKYRHVADSPEECQPMATSRAAAERAFAGTAPLLLCGETGVGKDRLARALHDACARDRAGAFVVVRCGSIGAADTAAELFGRVPGEHGADDPGRPGLVHAATGGTLYLDGIEDACLELQQALLAFLDTGEVRPVGSTELEQVDVRVIASSRRSPADLIGRALRPEFVERLKRVVVRVPPLRERRGEILGLVRTFASRYADREVSLHRKLLLALQRHRYPGNVRELEALVEAMVVEHDGDGPVLLTLETSERLASDTPIDSNISRVSAGGARMIAAASGAWFEYEGERTSLQSRKALRLLVAGLLERRRNEPGVPLSVDELLAIGWPDEVVIPEAGRNRVFVALTTLRKLGLRDVILRQDDGYYVDPAVHVWIEAD